MAAHPAQARPPRASTALALALALVASLVPSSVGATGRAGGSLVAGGSTPTLQVDVVKSGLVNPWDVAFTPEGRMFVTERPGRIRLYSSGDPGSALLMTFTVPNTWASGESGVMGIAVDRDYPVNQRVYVCRSHDKAGVRTNQVLAYRFTGSTLVFSNWVIRYGMRANTFHDGCAVEHGPDRKLWVTMGDAGSSRLAQDPDSYNGKVLRVDTDGSIPGDNPILPGAAGRSAVYTMGHRNPQGLAFQPITHEPYSQEHGPDRDDETNWIRPGLNYGWPCYTGNGQPYATAGCGPASDYTPPVWTSGSPTLATSGAAFVNGPNWGSWRYQFFVATLKQQDLRRFDPVSAIQFTMQQTLVDGTYGRLRASVRGPGGTLYLTTSNGTNDKIIRIAPTLP